MFQKRTVFAFTESWSRDQLMQKAYSDDYAEKCLTDFNSILFTKDQ